MFTFLSSATGGHLLAWERHAHPLSQRRHNQQEGLPPPLPERQVPGEPSHQEMTSHAAGDPLAAVTANRDPDLHHVKVKIKTR